MKKIQITAVKQMAEVEVIMLNSHFVAKCVHTHAKLNNIVNALNVYPKVATCPEDANENVIIDDHGMLIDKATGKNIMAYERTMLEPWMVEELATNIIGFFEELTNAFENEG